MGPKLNEQLCFALYAASNALTRAYRPLLEPLDLTYPQFVVMMALWEKDGVMISKLAKLTGLGKATMTPLLKRLEAKGFLLRCASENDDRQKSIILTEQGKTAAKTGLEASEKAFCKTGFELEQAGTLLNLCQELTYHLNNEN